MTLPRRIPKTAKRSERWRSPAHCNFIRQHECSVPGCGRRPIEVAHLRNGTDAATGRKASDYYAISLCGGLDGHHAEQHRIGEPAFQKRHGIDMHALAAEFAAASPKSGEIRLEQRARVREFTDG